MSKIITLKSHKCKSIMGKIIVPGDKSISHRALIFSAISIGRSEINGLLESDDVIKTLKALRNLGIKIVKTSEKYFVDGNGGIFTKYPRKLFFGNSGTGARLMIGLLATKNMNVTITGDKSLSQRPMLRILGPLTEMGANFSHNDGKLPIKILESSYFKSIKFKSKIGSAQIKSSILLAASNIKGVTEIEEEIPSRDHSELMLKYLGAKIFVKKTKNSNLIKLNGPCILKCNKITVPGDFSSAAFLIIAALLTKESNLTIQSVGLNYFRTGLLDVLSKMNANIKISDKSMYNGEAFGNIEVYSSNLIATRIDKKISARLIDEYPILFVACSFASGISELTGLEELKFKESDRLSAMTEALTKCGVKLEKKKNSLLIYGNKKQLGGCKIKTYNDHRIAMSMLIFGMISEKPVSIDDMSMITTSFPNFRNLMESIGAKLQIV